MKKISVCIISVIVLILSGETVSAGGYIGFSAGATSPEESEFKDDIGYKLTGGFKYSENLAFQASYVALGEFELDGAVVQDMSDYLEQQPGMTGYSIKSISMEITGIEVAIKGIVPLGSRVSIFARAGIFFWDAEAKATVSLIGYGSKSGSESDDGRDFCFGFGLNCKVTETIGLKAEFSRYEATDSDVDYLGGGMEFYF